MSIHGISEEELHIKRNQLQGNHEYQGSVDLIDILIDECTELQEPWMTLEEFLNSGFKGLCWIEFPSEIITDAYFDGHLFKHSSTSDFAHDENYITRVQPIHKPEPPR